MTPRLDEADLELLQALSERASATIQELCADRGVTDTAIRRRLDRLRSLGLVDRRSESEGRGRPHHRYRITQQGRAELGDNYATLAQVLWRAIQSIEDPRVKRRVLDRVRRELFGRFSLAGAAAVTDRMRHLEQALREQGYSVEIDFERELPVLQEHCCPYTDLAVADPSICRLEQDVYSDVLGVPVTLTHRCVDGHPCCEFTVHVDQS